MKITAAHMVMASAFVVAVFAGCAGSHPGDRGREIVFAKGAPQPIGPYSQGVRVGSTLWLAGQIGIDPATGALVAGGAAAETRQALENLRAVLAAAGFSLAEVVEAGVFVTDLDRFAEINAVYAEFFAKDPPARATVQVARLPKGAQVEIKLTAVRAGG